MTKVRLSRRLLKVAESKHQRSDIEKALKVLKTLRNQPAKARLVRTVVSADTVVVKVQESNSELRGVGPNRRQTRSSNGSVVDQSVKDTERAIRTIQRTPSEKVREFYERLAEQS